jgi:C4-dicarboxylate transporter DctM subunit
MPRIVVLVPLLLPLTRSYDIDPVHFGIIFLAAMEVGFLCPPAGMNLYFASAMFGKSDPLRGAWRSCRRCWPSSSAPR